MDSLEAIEASRENALASDSHAELRSLVFWVIPALIDKVRRTEANAVKAWTEVERLTDKLDTGRE